MYDRFNLYCLIIQNMYQVKNYIYNLLISKGIIEKSTEFFLRLF